MKIALTGALLASALVLPLAVTAGDFAWPRSSRR